MTYLNPAQAMLNRYTEFLRRDPRVIDVDGVLYRRPGYDADLGDIWFYEPLDWSIKAPPANHPMPLRMLLENEHSNASYDYHEINLAAWPELPVYGNRDRRRSYTRIREVAKQVGAVTVTNLANPLTAIDDVILDGSLADQTTVYNYLLNPQGYEWINLHTSIGEADFLISSCPDKGTAHYVKTRGLPPSVAVWHLLDQFAVRGITSADIWNVAATTREAYKRAFFTAASHRRCYYAGENPYPWLHLDGKTS